MRIGLLECDHVRNELLHIAGDYREMFPALFARVAPEWEFKFYDVCNGQFPETVVECDAYICTGSKSSVYDADEWIVRLKQFVLEIAHSESSFVGVCFGHQILGEALGGNVRKAETGWCVGAQSFEVIRQESWMTPSLSMYHVLMMCQDQVLELPPESTMLAANTDCQHAMFRVGENMLGIQGHPEFSKVYDKALMELRVERIGESKVAEGIKSLELNLDDQIIAAWIFNFITRTR